MRRLLITLLTLASTAVIFAPPAFGAFEFEDVDLSFIPADGTPPMQAGSHPLAMTNVLSVKGVPVGGGSEVPSGEVRDLQIDLPPGFAGNPTATERCSNADFAAISPFTKRSKCADSTAVGITEIQIAPREAGSIGRETLTAPVYNLVPGPGTAAKLGFVVTTGGVPVTIDVRLSEEAPYHVVAILTDVSQAVFFYSSKVTLWGNPSSPIHDSQRGVCAELVGKTCSSAGVAVRPFITLPTACTGPITTAFKALTWNTNETANAITTTHTDAEPPTPLGIGGCGNLSISPTIDTQPTSTSAESPTGLDVNVEIDDEGLTSPDGIAQSAIEKAVVTLPQGMTINPSQAEGLGACSEADLKRESPFSAPGAGCPNASKIGTVEVETPLLEEKILKGSLFVATPYQNPTGSLIALYMVFRNADLGIVVKQAGKVEPDPVTGQLISTFDGLPQLPFSDFRLHFREGGRSPLVTPPACGTYTTVARFYPFSAPASPYTTTSSFTVGSGVGGSLCPAAGIPPFAPGFEGGALNNAAGRYSPFYMRLTRKDGEQDMTRFSSILPPGVTGKIAGVPLCPDPAIAAAKARTGIEEKTSPSCPAASRIGRVLAGAGVGSELLYVPGQIYLAGPYNGAPLSVTVITPAVAGPFDVGNVVVREALDLNPLTGEVEVDGAASDPIPHILAGIPLKLRDLRIYVDRPQFTLNPTSCEPSSLRSTLHGSYADVMNPADDVPVSLSARFQAAGCASLGYAPKFSLKLSGASKRGGHPALRSVIRPRPGDANSGHIVLTLPPSQFIDNARIKNPCTRVQFNAGQCPPSSVLGTARAFTPLLDQPLEGPVYFRSNGGERLLPDVVFDLRGQFRIIAVGFVDSRNARVRTTFAQIPDAPVSKIEVNLFGGKRGLLLNNRNLCAHKLRAKLALTGKNGKRRNSEPVVATGCKKGKAAKLR